MVGYNMHKMDILNNVRKVYSKLRKQHPHKLIDEDYGINSGKPDYWFLAALCWIARGDSRQTELWDRVKTNFQKKYDEDIRKIITDKDCYGVGYPEKLVPYKWLTELSQHLNEKNISFSEFLDSMKNWTGIQIKKEFMRIMHVGDEKAKRISVFIRDYPKWKKDVFPIDRNVSKMLKCLGFPDDEEIMINLCREAKVDTKLFERLLYEHGKMICGHGKNCTIEEFCLSKRFNLDRC